MALRNAEPFCIYVAKDSGSCEEEKMKSKLKAVTLMMILGLLAVACTGGPAATPG